MAGSCTSPPTEPVRRIRETMFLAADIPLLPSNHQNRAGVKRLMTGSTRESGIMRRRMWARLPPISDRLFLPVAHPREWPMIRSIWSKNTQSGNCHAINAEIRASNALALSCRQRMRFLASRADKIESVCELILSITSLPHPDAAQSWRSQQCGTEQWGCQNITEAPAHLFVEQRRRDFRDSVINMRSILLRIFAYVPDNRTE